MTFIILLSYFLAFLTFLFANFSQRKGALKVSYALLGIGFSLYLLSLLSEYVKTKTFPVGDIYGMVSLIGNLSAFMFILLSRKYDFSLFGAIVSFIAFLTTVFTIPSRSLGFSNPLYILHIISAGLSYVFLIFGGFTSFSKILVERGLKRGNIKLPFAPLRILKKLEKSFIILTFVGLTLTLIFGSLWAKAYLGIHWVNDPKLLATLLLWIYYAFLSHMYLIRAFKPSQISFLSLLGTFLGLIALLFFRHSF
ncbi:cytochrome c biogenesis protein [Aquifex pyrophilus]